MCNNVENLSVGNLPLKQKKILVFFGCLFATAWRIAIVCSDMLRAWVDDGYDGAHQDPVEGGHTVAHQAPGVQTQQDLC